jgi:hypothetical protein
MTILSRRRFLLGSLVSAAFGSSANAEIRCAPHRTLGQICRAEVRYSAIAAVHDPQYQSQWCWAACLSTIFEFHGHPVSQQRIVREVYGAPINMPAFSGTVISAQLNRRWVDDNGNRFWSRLKAVFDADAGFAAINNAGIVGALRRDMPMIIGARSHAVVLTAIDFTPTPNGPRIHAGGCFDPWPGRGARSLAPDELVPVPRGSLRFIALAEIA